MRGGCRRLSRVQICADTLLEAPSTYRVGSPRLNRRHLSLLMPLYTACYCRPQIGRPPVLVAPVCAVPLGSRDRTEAMKTPGTFSGTDSSNLSLGFLGTSKNGRD